MLTFKEFLYKTHNSNKKNLFSSNIYNDKRIRNLMFNVIVMFNAFCVV